MKAYNKILIVFLISSILVSPSLEISQSKVHHEFQPTSLAQSGSKWWKSSSKHEDKAKKAGGWTNFKMTQTKDRNEKFGGFKHDKHSQDTSHSISGYRDQKPARTTRSLYESKSGKLMKKKKHYAASSSLTGSQNSKRTHKWETININRSSDAKKSKKSGKSSKNQKNNGWQISGSTGKGWNAFKEETETKDITRMKENLSPKKKQNFKVFRTQKIDKNGDTIITEEIIMDAPTETNNQHDFDALVTNMDPGYQKVKNKEKILKVNVKGKPFRRWRNYLPGDGKIKPEVKGNKAKKLPKAKRKCVKKAKIILEAQKLNCLDSKESSLKINDCLAKGKGLAKEWSKKCGVKIGYKYDKVKKIDYKTKIIGFSQKSEVEKKEIEKDLRCERNAQADLKEFLADCWKENHGFGNTGKMICGWKLKEKIQKWEKECKKKFKFKPKFKEDNPEEKKYKKKECLIEANRQVLKVIKKCWRQNLGLPKLIRKCLKTKGKKKAKKWSKICGKKIKYHPEMPKLKYQGKGHKKCLVRAKRNLEEYIEDCYELHRGKSWAILQCLKDGKSLANKWAKECKVLSIHYKPKLPKLYLKQPKKCTKEAYKIMRLYIAGCWRKYKGNNIAINSCLKRGKKISRQWSLLSKKKIKYQPTMANVDKNLSCKDQADEELKIYMKDCYEKFSDSHKDFKTCILDGKTLAQLWSDRCSQKIDYNPKIPEELPEEGKNVNKCVKQANVWLDVYEKDCWSNHRGKFDATMTCLRKGIKFAENFSKQCKTKIKYMPRLPERKNFCLNTANEDVGKFWRLCKKFNKGKKGNERRNCKAETLDVANKWVKECDGILMKKKGKLPKVIPKSRVEQKEEINKVNIMKIVQKRVDKIIKKKKIKKKNVEIIKRFLMKEIEAQLKISILNSKKDISKAITRAVNKKIVQTRLLKSSMKNEIKNELLNKKVNDILNSNLQELLVPEPKLEKDLIPTSESTDPEYIKQFKTFEKNKERVIQKKKEEAKSYNKQMVEFTNWSKESNNWISRLKQAKTRTEYDNILVGYKDLIKNFHKKFKNCLPPPPPSPVNEFKSPVENRCHKGYKQGFKHGKSWAKMVSNDNGTFMKGKRKLKCLIDWLKEKKNSLHHICAIRGAKRGYHKWWKLLHDKKKLKAYERAKFERERTRQRDVEYYKKMAKKIDQAKKGGKK